MDKRWPFFVYNANMQRPPSKIFPSILSADFGRLQEEVRLLEKSGADGIHIDIMDGHFVPNLTLGPKAVLAIRKATNLFLDVHLMMYNPFDYIERFVEAGADGITFHFEATEDIEDTLEFIQRCGKKGGIAFRPDTSFSMVRDWIPVADMVLLMTVEPGFGGQPFLSDVVEKIELTRQEADRLGVPLDIEVDGGIDPKSALLCKEAGANVFVSGHYLFSKKDRAQAIAHLRRSI